MAAAGVDLDNARNRLGVLTSARRRVRLVLTRHDRVDAGVSGVPAVRPGVVEFLAYAEDCLLTGHLRLDDRRLSDLLNAHEEFELIDVTAEDLATGLATEVSNFVVRREELLLVQGTGPRGDRGRRRSTRQHPIALGVGPYDVRGDLHALPGADPVTSFRRRGTIVALTDAWVGYEAGGIRRQHRMATLLVNRLQVESISEASEEHTAFLNLPSTVAVGGLVKEFTGDLSTAASSRHPKSQSL
jgi:hypothetical protein